MTRAVEPFPACSARDPQIRYDACRFFAFCRLQVNGECPMFCHTFVPGGPGKAPPS